MPTKAARIASLNLSIIPIADLNPRPVLFARQASRALPDGLRCSIPCVPVVVRVGGQISYYCAAACQDAPQHCAKYAPRQHARRASRVPSSAALITRDFYPLTLTIRGKPHDPSDGAAMASKCRKPNLLRVILHSHRDLPILDESAKDGRNYMIPLSC